MVCQFTPWVRAGLVFAGETSTSLAVSKTFCMASPTEEFSGPTTPSTSLLATSLVAFCWPTEAWPWFVERLDLEGDALDVLPLLAIFVARSTEFSMPRPSAERSPVSGASTPMTTVVSPLPESEPPPLSSREPQAVRVSAPAARAAVMAMSER
ncbi:hypothetical protein SALBM217S_02562 [Streptomyces griseoloalbus]